jgi:hypothetical protein
MKDREVQSKLEKEFRKRKKIIKWERERNQKIGFGIMQNSHSRQLKSFSMFFFSCFCLTVCQSKKRRHYINWVETIISMPHCLMKLAFGVCVCVISGEVRRGFEIHSSSFLSGLRSTMACSSSAVYLLNWIM